MTLVALLSLEKSWYICFRQSRTKVAGTVWAGSRVNVGKGRVFFHQKGEKYMMFNSESVGKENLLCIQLFESQSSSQNLPCYKYLNFFIHDQNGYRTANHALLRGNYYQNSLSDLLISTESEKEKSVQNLKIYI